MDTLEQWIVSFDRHLTAEGKSVNTRATYCRSTRELADWLRGEDVDDWEQVTRDHIRGWTINLLEIHSKGYANNIWRGAQAFCKWLSLEEDLPNPMAGLTPPKAGDKVVPVIPEGDLQKLLRACEGRDFVSRRDTALLRFFMATGCRLAEVAGLRIDDVDLNDRTALVTGKGDRQRRVRFDSGTSVAIDRYLRVRARSKYAHRPELWLAEANRGVLTAKGIYQMVERRGEQIGAKLHPHQFRHTLAHRFLAAGGAEGDLMAQAGWNTPAMLRRYGASASAERARDAYDRINPMGNL